MSRKHKTKRKRVNKTYKVKSYYSYINSSRWSKKRKAAVERAGFKCEICGAKARLEVHHLTYSTLGNEPPEHLQVLCEDCHCNRHEIDNRTICDPMTKEYREFIRNML